MSAEIRSTTSARPPAYAHTYHPHIRPDREKRKPSPSMLDRLRRRRLFYPLLAGTAILILLLFFSSSHDLLALPPVLQGLRPLSRASIAQLVRPRVDEISGLLYFVTQRPDAVLSLEGAGAGVGLDPAKPIALKVYEGEQKVDWAKAVEALNTETPLVVFSKTYCPYSKRAKELLKNYDLSPPPTVIEVDLRDDGDLIKAILTRLTSHSTFPNTILLGKSIGGSDQLTELHREGKLKAVLEEAGLKVKADIKTPEEQL